MAALTIFPVSVARGLYWLHDGGGKFTVDVQAGECNCAKGKKTRSCRHLEALQRYCRRHGLSFGPTDLCPACDGITGLPVPCSVCAGRGRLPAAEARALRQSKWGGRTEAQNRALWRRLGGETEIAPKTRVWPHKDAQGVWHFEAEEEPREAAA